MILDIGPRSGRARRALCSRARRRWSGTGRSAPSRWSRSTPARSRSRRRRRNSRAPASLSSVAGGGDTVAALNRRRHRALHLCLDRGRRVPRMARRQGAARRRGIAGEIIANANCQLAVLRIAVKCQRTIRTDGGLYEPRRIEQGRRSHGRARPGHSRRRRIARAPSRSASTPSGSSRPPTPAATIARCCSASRTR